MIELRYWFLGSLLMLRMVAAPVLAAEQLHWYRGNTHTHTINSDGDTSPDTVARWYKEHGYQFLFITDHEYLTDVGPLNALLGASERFLVLPGQEVTQWSDDPNRSYARVSASIGAGAHLNALFATKVVWPVGVRNCTEPGCGANAPADMPVAQTFKTNSAAILAEGAIPQINHPNLLWSLKAEDLVDVSDGSLFEIWNGVGDIANNLGGDDGKGDIHPSAEDLWAGLLDRGRVVWGVGSDDSHTFQTLSTYPPGEGSPGHAWIVVHAAALTPSDLRAAIEGGDFYASIGVALEEIVSDANQMTVVIKPEPMDVPNWAPPRYTTRFLGRNNQLLATVAGLRAVYRFKGSESYVRAVISDSNGKKAWTQPVFLDERRTKSPYAKR